MGWQVLTHDPSNKQAEAELTKARKRVLDERGFAPAEKPRRKMVRRGLSRGTRGVLQNTQGVLKGPSTDTQGVHAGCACETPGLPDGNAAKRRLHGVANVRAFVDWCHVEYPMSTLEYSRAP